VMIGSRAWIGKLSLKDLGQTKDKDGIRYLQAMDQCGIVCEDFSTLKAEQVKAMVELHIEQSVVLEKRGLQIGLVEGIAGIKQFIVTIHGIPNHAGGTPMGLRYDALQGAIRIIGAAEEIAREMREPTVATTGFISCEPGQVNVIPERVQFTLDIRDTDSKRLEEAVKTIMAVTEKTCQERGLTNDIKPRSDTPPVALSKKVVQLIENVARERKIEPLRMMSGALHDSSILAEITDVGMIFVPSKEGKSHSPDEFTDLKDIEVGADILLHTVVKLAS